jgi:hypothetical protein
MAGTNGSGAETVAGVVSAVNPKGIRLEGRDGWLNFSKFAPGLVPPARGAHVAVTLDGQGFVRALAPADPESTIVDSLPTGQSQARRDTAITRLAVLKAAAEFAAGRAEIKSGDVLAIAERWEAWVTR